MVRWCSSVAVPRGVGAARAHARGGGAGAGMSSQPGAAVCRPHRRHGRLELGRRRVEQVSGLGGAIDLIE